MGQWQQILMEFCKQANIEPVLEGHKLILVCADEPSKEVQYNLTNVLKTVGSDVQFQFLVAPKPSTMKILGELVKSVEQDAEQGSQGISRKDGRLIIDLKLSASHPFWGQVSGALKTDGYFKDWLFIIDGKEVKVNAKVLVEQESNARFEKKLDDNDVLDVKIALESSKSVDEFLASL